MPQGEDGTAPGSRGEAVGSPFRNAAGGPKLLHPLRNFCLLFPSPSQQTLPGLRLGTLRLLREGWGEKGCFFPSWKRQKSSLLCQISPEPSSVSHYRREENLWLRSALLPLQLPRALVNIPVKKGELNPVDLAGRDAGPRRARTGGGWKTNPLLCSYICPMETFQVHLLAGAGLIPAEFLPLTSK